MSTGRIITALKRAYKTGTIGIITANEMIQYAVRHPRMWDCSQGIHAIVDAYLSETIGPISAMEHIWDLLHNSR